MKVVIGYRTKEHLDEAMKLLGSASDRVHAINVDVTDRGGMEAAAEETVRVFGKVHMLVNNAGITMMSRLSETSYEDWDWLVGVNLNGVFNGIRAFLPRIKTQGEGGQIVATSSVLGLFATGEQGGYCATKYALVGLMEALRDELSDTNIGVSVCCPGLVKSNIFDAYRNRPGHTHDLKPDHGMQRLRELMNDPQSAMDPLEAGRRVLQGVRSNNMYIFTHPEYEPWLKDRNDALIASIRSDLHSFGADAPTKERISSHRTVRSLYTAERDHRLCDLAESQRITKSAS